MPDLEVIYTAAMERQRNAALTRPAPPLRHERVAVTRQELRDRVMAMLVSRSGASLAEIADICGTTVQRVLGPIGALRARGIVVPIKTKIRGRRPEDDPQRYRLADRTSHVEDMP